MKLITFDDGRVGRLELEENLVIELDVPSTRTYFELEGKVSETGERLAYSDVRLRAPIVPKKFFHTAGNFAAHHEELEKVNWSHPVHKGIVFFQNVDAIIGPDDEIVYPDHLTHEMDYELEMLAVIGKPGKFFSPDDAVEHIAGFTIFNDISARDIQRKEMESGVFSFSKAIDTFCPIGPYIVTIDEVPDYPEPRRWSCASTAMSARRATRTRWSSRCRTSSRTTRRRPSARATSSRPARSAASRRSRRTRSTST